MPATTPVPTPISVCRFKCCHRCRPYLRERLPISIESVLKNEHRPMCAAEAARLPIIDAQIARKFTSLATPSAASATPPAAVALSPATSEEMVLFSQVDTDPLQGYSPVPESTRSTPISFASSTRIEEEELDIRLRRLVTGSQPALLDQPWPKFDLPLRSNTIVGRVARSESDSSTTHESGFLSPSRADSFSTFLGTNSDTTPASSPGKSVGLSSVPTPSRQPSAQLGRKAVLAARDNSSMESLGLDNDMVLVEI